MTPDTDIYQAIALLLRRRLTGVPVVDDSGILCDSLKVAVGGAVDGLLGERIDDYPAPLT